MGALDIFRYTLWILAPVAAIPVGNTLNRQAVLKTNTQTTAQFPNNTWLENIAVRANGQLLVTTIVPDAAVYQVDPTQSHEPLLIAKFPSALACFGIVELGLDEFIVTTNNWTLSTAASPPGSNSAWKIDMTKFSESSGQGAVITKVADISTATYLNGMTVLDKTAGTVLMGDATLGIIFYLDTCSGEYQVVLDDVLMKITVPGPVKLGINGVRLLGDELYFTNNNQGLFVKVPIEKNGTAKGSYEIVARFDTILDDFAFDTMGNSYVTTDPDNTVDFVTQGGNVTTILGNKNSTLVAGATSAAFGRRFEDEGILYIPTNGGLAGPVNGTFIEGGKVVAFDTSAVA
ncbi:hypothetical protein BP5796_08285 [Coleophoma crateriformis]|uniref:SMP-30/Gluconolactonase/LRE-like region domain-containing protein n=1 Tax=Coleophoma crateriformis TaxID=565419 RepID=A0A3D8R7I6_9HELO|nr:hypothetical protein BP5796_08285 [Coleophoma crateriformis]